MPFGARGPGATRPPYLTFQLRALLLLYVLAALLIQEGGRALVGLLSLGAEHRLPVTLGEVLPAVGQVSFTTAGPSPCWTRPPEKVVLPAALAATPLSLVFSSVLNAWILAILRSMEAMAGPSSSRRLSMSETVAARSTAREAS
jgi:hypothetical protein